MVPLFLHGIVCMKKNKNTVIQYTPGYLYDVISRNHEELKKFVETINMMR